MGKVTDHETKEKLEDLNSSYSDPESSPQLFNQPQLNDLVRDLGLPKNAAVVLASRLQEKDRLTRLNEQLEDFDFTTTVRDPHYEPFVRAMAEMERAEKLQTIVLSKEQREKRKQLAAELLRKIKT